MLGKPSINLHELNNGDLLVFAKHYSDKISNKLDEIEQNNKKYPANNIASCLDLIEQTQTLLWMVHEIDSRLIGPAPWYKKYLSYFKTKV